MTTWICPRCDGHDAYEITEQRLRNLPTNGNPNFWMTRLNMKTEAVYVTVWKCKACGEYMISKELRDRKIEESRKEELMEAHKESLKNLMQSMKEEKEIISSKTINS